MENEDCVGVNHGQWKISIAWVKGHDSMGRMEILRLYKI